jgi:ABC-type lipoprotein export system ATPase subunit
MELFKKLNEQGATIIQVTHSEANAAYSDRTIQLFDGWIAKDPANSDAAPAVAGPQSR